MRLIDADAIDIDDISCSYGENCKLDDVQELIDDQPTVDAQPVKHGTWERTDMFVKCSECGVELLDDAFFSIHVFDDGYMPYCPNCGSYNGGDEK